MMSRFQRSWDLFKKSVSVMIQHKQLLVFPIVILVLTLCILALFITPVVMMFVAQGVHAAATDRQAEVQGFGALAGLYFILIYFVSMFSATFFNVAFYHEIMEALQGRPVSIGNGLRFASTRWKSILLWSLFAGLIGYIIRALEQKFGLFGRIIMALVGTAWSVACIFVIPVIIQDEATFNPIEILKKSVSTLKRTWGESLIGYVGISLASWLVLVFSLFWLGGTVAMAVFLNSIWLGVLAGAGWLITIIIFSYLTSVANQIFRCALFLYATTGAMPQPFDADSAALAWKMKRA